MINNFSLRHYQKKAHDSALAKLGTDGFWDGSSDTYQSVIISTPTGSGKTLTAASIIETLIEREDARILFLADQDELCQQPVKAIYRSTGIIPSVEKASDRASLSANVVVGSLQTLDRENRLSRFPRNHFTHIIQDECHRNIARSVRVREHFNQSKVIGFTATPFRAGLKDLSDYFDDVAYALHLYDLVDDGYLVGFKVDMVPLEIDLSQVKQKRGIEGQDFNQEDLEFSIRPWYEAVAQEIVKRASDRHIICYLPLIKSSQEFSEILRDHGITARHIDGKSTDREQILEAFGRGEFQALCNSDLVSTGVDIPLADCMCNLSPTRSAVRFRQRAGRISRVLPGLVDHLATPAERKAAIAASAKPNALILDFLWQAGEIGLQGPSGLIARTEDEADEIGKMLRKLRTPKELEEISEDFKAKKEDELRKKLEALSKRKAQFIDARMLGIMMHSREIADFEPVMKWEKKPISPGQQQYLQKQGIDIETVNGRGHASAIIDSLMKRKNAGLASLDAVKLLKSKGIEKPEEMTAIEAERILGDQTPFPFGKHKGRAFDEIPDGYWNWLEEQEWVKTGWPRVWAHLQSRKQPEIF